VAASLQAPELFTIAEDLGKMQVDTAVAESDVGRLTEGMAVSFTVDAYPARSFPGQVRQVRNVATTTSNVVTYDAVIDVDNRELLLKPGMTANATFIVAEAKDALRIPGAALRFKPSTEVLARYGLGPQHGGKLVYKLDAAGKLSALHVKLGVSDGSKTQLVAVEGGELAAGDKLVTDLDSGESKPATSSAAPGMGGGGRGMGGMRGGR
jgi:HlyD family secretion protein